DSVFVPLEDGDRTEGLVKLGKQVITVDLNPLSRTAQMATITIVDNVVRALPLMIEFCKELRNEAEESLRTITNNFDNRENLSEAIQLINERLTTLANTKTIQTTGE
ncbi:MAG: phosphopantothenate/pantothenate synthetase family protein, partial [Candidatus Odinarchaeota archaeon]